MAKKTIKTSSNSMQSTNIDQLITQISKAALGNKQYLFAHFKRTNSKDHTNIESFQKAICNCLNNNPIVQSNYQSWKIEVKPNGRIEKDSVDIMGNPKSGNYRCIIEIDACRNDQVSAKFLSRLTLWGLNQPIIYVALLYSRPQQNNLCEKNVFYANTVLKKINNNSIAVGIYIDVDINSNSGCAKIWDYNKNGKYIVKTKQSTNPCNGMAKCATAAIREYVNAHQNKTYKDLQNIFGKYINDQVGKLRYKDTGMLSSDKIPIFSYSDFRGKGPRSIDWHIFTGKCSKNGINIFRDWPVII